MAHPRRRCDETARRSRLTGGERETDRLPEVQTDTFEGDPLAHRPTTAHRFSRSIKRSSVFISPDSRKSAACARSASLCGRAGYPGPRISRGRDIAEHPGLRADTAPLPTVRCPASPTWPASCAVLDMRRAGNAHLRHDETERTDPNVVTDVHEIVDLRPRPDHRVIDAAAIDRRVRANLHIVADDAAPDVRDLLMRAVPEP